MKSVRPLSAVLAISALLAGFTAAAANKKIKESRDWSLWETKVGSSDVCYLQANDDNYYFLILKNKNRPDSVVEVMMQMPENSRGVTGMQVALAGVPNQMAFADINGKKTNFWAVSKNLSSWIAQMRTESQKLQIRGVGGKKEETAEISTKGFNTVLTEMQNRCNAGASLVNAELETHFLGGVADVVNPLVLDITKAAQARSLYFAAFNDALQVDSAKAELAAVLRKYQPLTDELSQNRATASRLQGTDLPGAQNALVQAQRQQVDARATIARVDSQTPGMNAKIQASQKAYDAARAALAPHEPEYNRLTGSLNSAQSNLSSAQSRLAAIEDRLRSGSQQISSLSYEANTIERSLPQKRNDLNYARSILRDAQNQRASYNVSWERDRRLRSNFEYSRLLNERSSAESNLRVAEQQLQQARRDRDLAAAQLRQCQTSPMVGMVESAEGDAFPGIRPPGPGGPRPPGGPGGPGGPHPRPPRPPGPGPGPGPVPPGPVPPTPPAPRDCSAQQQSLNQANAVLAEKERAQRAASDQRNAVASRINQIERQADSEVNREYSNLVSREEQARRDADRIENAVNSDEARISQIRFTELPRLEREQSQLSSEKPAVQNNISSAQSMISSLTQELSRFKSSTGWDRKAAAVDTTGRQLRADQDALATAQAQKVSAQRALESGALAEAQSKALIDSLNAQLTSLNQRAAELQRGLTNLPAERAPHDARIAGLYNNLRAKQTDLLNLLR